MGKIIGYLLVALLFLYKPLTAGVARAYASLKARVPSGFSLKGVLAGVLGYELKCPLWKAVVIAIAIGLINSGGGVSLPTNWNIPSWFHINSLPLSGMRVLILEETAPAKPLTNEQSLALKSLDVRTYLDNKTLADSKGGKGWRKEDPDSSFANLPQEWQDIRAKVKPTESPWVAVADSTGKIAFEGPYPATETDALAFFKKYGG